MNGGGVELSLLFVALGATAFAMSLRIDGISRRVAKLEGEMKILGQGEGFWREAAVRHLSDYNEARVEGQKYMVDRAGHAMDMEVINGRLEALEARGALVDGGFKR